MRMVMAATGAVHVWLVMCVSMFVLMGFVMCMLVCMACMRAVLAISAVFRLKGFVNSYHRHVHVAQHIGQHMVGFDFQ